MFQELNLSSDGGGERMHHIKTSPGVGKRPLDALLAFPTESKMVVFCGKTPTVASNPRQMIIPLTARRFYRHIFGTGYVETVCFCADKVVQSPVPLTFARRRALLSGYLGDMLEMEKV
ncbi:hypothetical protein HDU86_000662 [Geranomyces michiganensis]|nr:hypothetical protein HDU86_000662 [Geranomyces michiganensis]